MAIEPIKDIIPTVIQNLSERKPNSYEKLQRAWEKALPKKDMRHLVLEGMKDGHLSVLVDSPATLFHMNMQKKKTLEKLRNDLPGLKSISFKIGKKK